LTTSLKLFITQMHDHGFGLIGPNWASSGACRVQNAYMQDYIYASTTWRVTSSVPTQYRRYMYNSVADLMAAGSWQSPIRRETNGLGTRLEQTQQKYL